MLSDHADWNGLLSVIKATEAERVLITHGYSPPLVRFLNEQGISADSLETAYLGEAGGDEARTEPGEESGGIMAAIEKALNFEKPSDAAALTDEANVEQSENFKIAEADDEEIR